MAHDPGKLVLKTPEGILFPLELAGPVTRCMAWALDLVCIVGLQSAAGLLMSFWGILSADAMQAFIIFSYFAVSIGYGLGTELWWRGQTVGKRVFDLRVMDRQGLRLHHTQIILRNLLRFVDVLPAAYLLGGCSMLVTRRAQRLGDLAARTIVVRIPPLFQPDLEELFEDKYNSFRAWPHLAARLRQRVSPEEARLALSALLRRDELSPEARVELFARMAAHFDALVPFPDEATLGISDERRVRNVVDILYRA